MYTYIYLYIYSFEKGLKNNCNMTRKIPEFATTLHVG